VLHAAAGLARVEFTSLIADAAERIERGRPAAFVCEPFDDDGFRVHEFASALRNATPPLPVIILSPTRAAHWTRSIPGDGSLHVSRLAHLELRGALQAVLARERSRLRRIHAAAACVPLVAIGAREAVRYAIENGDRPMGVPHLAASIGTPRKSLDRYLSLNTPLTAREIIVWGRLLAIGIELDDPNVTVASISPALRFTSASALRNLLQRHTGLTPSELRARGGLQEILSRFRAAIAARPVSPAASGPPLDGDRLSA
jgi:AraC-like DNA-binding protein